MYSNAASHWAAPTHHQNYDSTKNAGWKSGPGNRDYKNQNSRSKPQWNNSWRHQQTKYAADGSRAREWGAPRGGLAPTPPPPWQPPMAATPSPGTQQGPVAVTLEGLPPALCKQMLLEAILEQAGLTDCVTGCILGEEKDTGKALIYFSNHTAAQMCIEHFGGCCWDRAGQSVLAQMVDIPSEQLPQGPVIQPPMAAMDGGMITMPQPSYTHMVYQPPWDDFAPASYMHNMVPAMGEDIYDASTVAGDSTDLSNWGSMSPLTSQLSSGDSGNLAVYDEGCDTDDGF